MRSERIETRLQLVALLIVGGMAGAASFTHVHDWTMHNSPADTPAWFGWANAVVSELTPLAAGLEIRRRRRVGRPIGYPLALLIAAGTLSLSAQVAMAKPGISGWLLAAVPALAFLALTKLVLGRSPIVPVMPAETSDAVPVVTSPEIAKIEPAKDQANPSMPTGKKADVSPSRADVKTAAREAYRASVVAGKPLSGAELARQFRRSDRWGSGVIAAAREIDGGRDWKDEPLPGLPEISSPTAVLPVAA